MNSSVSSGGERRLLVVDDQDSIRRMLSRALRKMGKVDACANGREALACTRSSAYDAVISDMDMPGMSGLEFYRRIRKADESISRRFILISGRDHPDIMRLKAKGLIRFLQKPFLITDIRKAVKAVIGQDGGDPKSGGDSHTGDYRHEIRRSNM